MKILYNAIDEKDFDKLITCSSANEIWLALEEMYSLSPNQICKLYKSDDIGESDQEDELHSQPQKEEEDETD